MEIAEYEALDRLIESRDDTRALALERGVSLNALLSLYGAKYARLTRRTLSSHKARSREYYARCCLQGEHLLEMAERESIAPCLLARFVLDEYQMQKEPSAAARRRLISAQLKQPELIDDASLSAQVRECVQFDDNYSPLVESLRHNVGAEFEFQLQSRLRHLHIPFLTEAEMAARGYPKTPDIKFEVPILVEGRFVVNWIESKATFADPETLTASLRDQFTAYSNRYGPGLVIYWFGHVKPDAEVENGVLIRDDLPTGDQIIMLDGLI